MSERKIVLLSDGTGNSSGQINRTNVWRLYQTIDTSDGDQLCFYDDGVGSGGFKLLRYLGGAIGLGMARNARQLYEELCRHYRGTDDKVLLFGFSRGAFTIRVVAGIIQHCGIIDRRSGKSIRIWSWSRFRPVDVPLASDTGLKAAVRLAYRDMRRKGNNPWPQALVRLVHDLVAYRLLKLTSFRAMRKRFSVSPRPRIAFLGVFDTVSAYGLPVEEMAIAIDRMVVRLRFPDMILSRKVEHACQALAMDEARQSFHPVLWTQKFLNTFSGNWEIDERPQQVWFAGMHADVGGGYGDGRLSYIPLQWMLAKAEHTTGLKLRSERLEEYRENTTVAAPMHDSRGGLASFYRYKPRTYEALHRQDLDGNGNHEIIVERFKIDRSIFERIKATGADYAPLGVPEDYDVVTWSHSPGGSMVETVEKADVAGIETAAQRRARSVREDAALDLIFCRQILYYLMLLIVAALIVVPLWWLPNPSYLVEGKAAGVVGSIASLIQYVPFPKSGQIAQFWTQHAWSFLGLAGAYVLSWFASVGLKSAIQAVGQDSWRHLIEPMHIPKPNGFVSWIRMWRSNTKGFHRVWTKRLLPVFTLALLVVALVAVPAWRWILFRPIGGESVCSVSEAFKPALQPAVLGTVVPFKTKSLCLNTGFNLQQGRLYELSIKIDQPWLDLRYPAAPDGLQWRQMNLLSKIKMISLAFTRRFWTEDWFALMGSIGRGRDHVFRIEARPDGNAGRNVWRYKFKAWRSGRLYLFVNDALRARSPGRDLVKGKSPKDVNTEVLQSISRYYKNNKGTASVSVTEISEL